MTDRYKVCRSTGIESIRNFVTSQLDFKRIQQKGLEDRPLDGGSSLVCSAHLHRYTEATMHRANVTDGPLSTSPAMRAALYSVTRENDYIHF